MSNINNQKPLKKVTEEEFNLFLIGKDTTTTPGAIEQTTYWLDNNLNKIAFKITSMYGTIHMIESDEQ